MVWEKPGPQKIVGVVATALQAGRGGWCQHGGQQGTRAKTLGLLPRRPAAGNREPCAAPPVLAGLRCGGRGRAGRRRRARAQLAGLRSGSRAGASSARRRLPVELCSSLRSSLPLLIVGCPVICALRATPAGSGARGQSSPRQPRSRSSRGGVEGEGPAKRERSPGPSVTPQGRGEQGEGARLGGSLSRGGSARTRGTLGRASPREGGLILDPRPVPGPPRPSRLLSWRSAFCLE